MVYSPVMNAFRLSPQEASGQPDYYQSMMNALKGMNQATETAFKPKTMAEELLAKQMKNKIDKPFADNADQWFQAQMGEKGLNNSLLSMRLRQAAMEMQQNQMLNDALGGQSVDNMPSSPVTSSPSSNYDFTSGASNGEAGGTFPGRGQNINAGEPVYHPTLSSLTAEANAQGGAYTPPEEPASTVTVLAPGNESLEHINKLYDEKPIARKLLESKGYKKTVSVKTDPRTGISSVTTTYPNGRVEVRSTSGGQGPVPLTNTVKTLHQQIIGGVPKVKQMIDDLKAAPSPFEIPGIKSDQQAAHKALVNSAAETYAKAKGWPNTNESIHRASTILDRGLLESDSSYRRRLETLKSTLDRDVQESKKILQKGISGAADAIEESSAVALDPLGIR